MYALSFTPWLPSRCMGLAKHVINGSRCFIFRTKPLGLQLRSAELTYKANPQLCSLASRASSRSAQLGWPRCTSMYHSWSPLYWRMPLCPMELFGWPRWRPSLFTHSANPCEEATGTSLLFPGYIFSATPILRPSIFLLWSVINCPGQAQSHCLWSRVFVPTPLVHSKIFSTNSEPLESNLCDLEQAG